MIEQYRIVKGPIGYNVEGLFNITFKRSWVDRIIGVPKGIYGWHLLDQSGHIWRISRYMIWRPAVYDSLEKAQRFIEWQKSVGIIVQ